MFHDVAAVKRRLDLALGPHRDSYWLDFKSFVNGQVCVSALPAPFPLSSTELWQSTTADHRAFPLPIFGLAFSSLFPLPMDGTLRSTSLPLVSDNGPHVQLSKRDWDTRAGQHLGALNGRRALPSRTLLVVRCATPLTLTPTPDCPPP